MKKRSAEYWKEYRRVRAAKNWSDIYASSCEEKKTTNKLYYETNKEKWLTYQKGNYYRHKEDLKIKHQKYNSSPKAIFSVYQRNAKKRGIVFNLTFEQFFSFWQKPCICGCEIDTIGLDRINNSKGYEIDNVRPMCREHNWMRTNLSDEDTLRLAKGFVKALEK